MSRGGQNTSFGKKQLVTYHRKRGKNCRDNCKIINDEEEHSCRYY